MAPLLEVVAAGADELEVELLLELEPLEELPVDPVEFAAGAVAVEDVEELVIEVEDSVEEVTSIEEPELVAVSEGAEEAEDDADPVGALPAASVGVDTPSAAQAWAITKCFISMSM